MSPLLGHVHWLTAVGTGLIQGVVEWLPVSSKTMSALFLMAAGVSARNAYTLGLLANFGSFFAALYYFRREVGMMLRALAHPLDAGEGATLLRFVVLATLATGVVGLPLYVWMSRTFSAVGGSVAMLIIGVLLLATAAIARKKERLLAAEQAQSLPSPTKEMGTPRITPAAALIVGAFQGVAALPGISRSALTMTPMLWLGYSGDQALRLSFLLDVPGLLGAGAVPMVVNHGGELAISAIGPGTAAIMLLVSAVVSLLTIDTILKASRRLPTSVVTLAIAVLTIAVALVLMRV